MAAENYDQQKKFLTDEKARTDKYLVDPNWGKNTGKWYGSANRREKYETSSKDFQAQLDALEEGKTKAVAEGDPNSVSGRMKIAAGGYVEGKAADAVQGAQFAETILGDGLGRMGVDQAQTDIEAKAKEMSQGFSSAEALARQEKGMEGIAGGSASQMRGMQAALSRSGVKGQAAGAQIGQLAQEGVKARGNLERDLIIENRAAQERGMQGWGQAIQNRQANEKFDLGQVAKEKEFIGQGALGYMGMGVTERSAAAANKATVDAANSQKSGGGGTVICTELHRQGLMSDEMYKKEQAWGRNIIETNPCIYVGYFIWAQYLAKAMSKSKLLTNILKVPALAWANQLVGNKSFLGAVIYRIGVPVCATIGKIYLALTKESILKQS